MRRCVGCQSVPSRLLRLPPVSRRWSSARSAALEAVQRQCERQVFSLAVSRRLEKGAVRCTKAAPADGLCSLGEWGEA